MTAKQTYRETLWLLGNNTQEHTPDQDDSNPPHVWASVFVETVLVWTAVSAEWCVCVFVCVCCMCVNLHIVSFTCDQRG